VDEEIRSPHDCRVLVVDEHEDVRELLRVSLSADGYAVAAVRSGRQALAYLRSTADTCLILLGLAGPTLEITRFRAAQLRDRSLAWIPVVLMSGGVDAAQKARAFGARGFVRTPLDLDQVRETLRKIGCGRAPTVASPREPHR
jgi:CheY-like chemotaxis protein